MKILHIVHSMILNSGVSVFTGEVARAQAEAGHDVQVFCWACPDYSIGKKAKCEAVTTLPHKFDADVVHIGALWDSYQLKAMRKCRSQGIPYVISPHGGLMPRVFTKGRLKKFVFWHFLLKPLLKKAAAIHCTSESEKEACIKLGLPGPFIIAPLGVHLPPTVGDDHRASRLPPMVGDDHRASRDSDSPVGARVPSRPQRNILFLGRLSEEKGLLNLLEAWHQLQQEGIIHCSPSPLPFPHLSPSPVSSKLILAGPDWHGYKATLDAKIAADHIEGVEFTGKADAAMKDKLYREADIFVLPSPMENFSMVVLDALAYGVPVIATKGTPWQELESERCGFWIDQGVEPLKAALVQLLNLSTSELRALGANGRALAERKYQWPAIAQSLIACYKEISK